MRPNIYFRTNHMKPRRILYFVIDDRIRLMVQDRSLKLLDQKTIRPKLWHTTSSGWVTVLLAPCVCVQARQYSYIGQKTNREHSHWRIFKARIQDLKVSYLLSANVLEFNRSEQSYIRVANERIRK